MCSFGFFSVSFYHILFPNFLCHPSDSHFLFVFREPIHENLGPKIDVDIDRYR